MPRVILGKGSPEAIAWAAKMQAAREKKKKSIRELGKHREIQHFGEMRKNSPKKKTVVKHNPAASVRANIAGVIYNRCVEIRAEKTVYEKGYYRHPFARASKVCVLALDNGDILIHSKSGVNLWKPA